MLQDLACYFLYWFSNPQTLSGRSCGHSTNSEDTIKWTLHCYYTSRFETCYGREDESTVDRRLNNLRSTAPSTPSALLPPLLISFPFSSPSPQLPSPPVSPPPRKSPPLVRLRRRRRRRARPALPFLLRRPPPFRFSSAVVARLDDGARPGPQTMAVARPVYARVVGETVYVAEPVPAPASRAPAYDGLPLGNAAGARTAAKGI